MADRAAMTEEPEVNGLLQRVLDFVRALRRGGVTATQSEAIDAVQSLRHLDLLDRPQLREALAAVIVTSKNERRTFDELFDVYFPARWVDGGTDDPERAGDDVPEELDPDEYMRELIDRLMEGDAATIREMARRAVEQFGRVEGRDGGTSYFQYRVFRAVDIQQLLEDLLRRQSDEHELTELERRLWRDEFEARLREFREEVEAEIRRRAAAERGTDQVADRMTSTPLEEVDFFRLSRDEQKEMRAQIRPLARKLATRVAAKRKRGRDGRLDVRTTVRRSLATGGVPFEPAFKPRKPHKPELFLICDVSGSVASFARFTLMLVHTLQEQFSKVRSFAFIDALDEVTSIFETGEFSEGVKRMMSEADLVWFDGHSDYGHSLEGFHQRYADDVSPKSTVLILGDARNNYRQANAWVLEDLKRKARRLFWLNPEPVQFWDTGDSIAANYGRYVDDMVEVRNLKQLTAFVQEIA